MKLEWVVLLPGPDHDAHTRADAHALIDQMRDLLDRFRDRLPPGTAIRLQDLDEWGPPVQAELVKEGP